ncbi:MAG TPA: tetratricopeptide repeat protein [Candidatus Eisenbacteria bacterium]|nr:tetratricopeptide repeat protein [Candidatus Eisenbacteria bacterium]
MIRARRSAGRVLSFAVAVAIAMAAGALVPGDAAAKTKEAVQPEPPPVTNQPVYPPPLPPLGRDEELPRVYGEMVRRFTNRGPADTLGDGIFATAEAAFRAGAFDEAAKHYKEFAQKYTRNLAMNDALERILLIKEMRDFDDEPLRAFARAVAMRGSGEADSAAAVLRAGLTRYPGARIRYHMRYLLAELARDRGDHATAIEYALAVADTTSRSRLAPYALKLAGDETLAMGAPPERAAGYYQALLERYPDSPLAAGVRARILALRKRSQL